MTSDEHRKKSQFKFHKKLGKSGYSEFLNGSGDVETFGRLKKSQDQSEIEEPPEYTFKIDTYDNKIMLNKQGSSENIQLATLLNIGDHFLTRDNSV